MLPFGEEPAATLTVKGDHYRDLGRGDLDVRAVLEGTVATSEQDSDPQPREGRGHQVDLAVLVQVRGHNVGRIPRQDTDLVGFGERWCGFQARGTRGNR